MRFKHILYPSAKEKLDSSGITDRIREAKEKGKLSILGHLVKRDVVDLVGEMVRENVFDHLPENEAEGFKRDVKKFFENIEDYSWKVNRFGGEMREEADLEDVVSMVGWTSFEALSREEIFDYEKFGFRNITDFTGSVAALANMSNRNFRKGYEWETKLGDGRIMRNEISGDLNCDLRILQDDVTPYQTFDPLGNEVSYRPEFGKDRGGVYGYHSVEGTLLAAVLDWIDQCKIDSESLRNGPEEVIDWAKSLGQRGGSCAEHFGGFEENPRMFFNYSPLTEFDENMEEKPHPAYGLSTGMGGGYYHIYVSPEKELVILGEDSSRFSARFFPEEADHLVKGLIYQSAVGLGRTSAKQLISILDYRFSEDYQEYKNKIAQRK